MADIEAALLPARLPPAWGLFDVFPFSLLVKHLTRKGHEMKGKKAARMRAKLRSESVSHNIPLEISLYLSSYVGALQARKTLDAPTTSEIIRLRNVYAITNECSGAHELAQPAR
jgi:ion channel-forming bestrophin family protein